MTDLELERIQAELKALTLMGPGISIARARNHATCALEAAARRRARKGTTDGDSIRVR